MLRAKYLPAVEQVDNTPAQHIGKYVVFHHPGYSTGDNELFRLPAVDGPNGGIDFNVALYACAIFARNRFDGHFTLKTPNDARDTAAGARSLIERPADNILPPGEYFYHVPTPHADNEQYTYPVPASFADWDFPHDTLPDCWRNQGHDVPRAVSSMRAPAAGIAQRDGFCRISAHYESVQMAHVIPESEWVWYAANGMRRYANQGYRHGADILTDSDNKLLLRSDLHTLWDNRAFVFAPKDKEQKAFALHVLQDSTELLVHYHNVPTYPLSISRELLFARFAWALLPRIRSFLTARQKRTVCVRLENGEIVTRELSADQCTALVEQRKRSCSPKKRKAQESNTGMQEITHDILWAAPSTEGNHDSPAADSAYEAHGDYSSGLIKGEYASRRRKRQLRDERVESEDEDARGSNIESERGRKRHRMGSVGARGMN